MRLIEGVKNLKCGRWEDTCEQESNSAMRFAF